MINCNNCKTELKYHTTSDDDVILYNCNFCGSDRILMNKDTREIIVYEVCNGKFRIAGHKIDNYTEITVYNKKVLLEFVNLDENIFIIANKYEKLKSFA